MAQDDHPDEAREIKRKALTRLAIAGIVTLITLGILWWLDDSGKQPAQPPEPMPAPIVTAPAVTTAPPEAAPVEIEPQVTEAPAPVLNEPPPPPEVPPAPPASRTGTTQPPPPPDAVQRSTARPGSSTGHAPSSRPPKTVTPVPPSPAEAPSEPGFVVQMGVFSDPANAQVLVERLRKAGIQASTETRVHLGPFRNRSEAEKARLEIRRLGLEGVIATK